MKYLALPFIILAPFSIFTMWNSEIADKKTAPFPSGISLPDTNGITTDNFGYSYIAPENWTLEKGNGYHMYTQKLADGSQGCRLVIIPPVISSGKLEEDVKSIFSQMYPGWQFYYSDARRDNLIKGTTKQGAPYYMLEANMVKDRPAGGWDYETGAALVIGNGKQCAIMALRHEITGLNCLCKKTL